MIIKKSFFSILNLGKPIIQQSLYLSHSFNLSIKDNKNDNNFYKNIKSKKQSIYKELNFKCVFNFNTSTYSQSMIYSLQQYQNGLSMLQKGQYPVSIRQFQMALKFLPKNVEGNNNYKMQYQSLLKKLLQAHAFMNKPIIKFRQLYKQYIDQSSKFNNFLTILQDLQKGDLKHLQNLQTQNKLWKQLVRTFSFKYQKQCFGKHLPIQKISQTKDLALKYIGLYLFEKIKNRTRKDREQTYLNTCRELLKQTQQFQPTKIVKALSLMASNLLAGDQYLQAQGLMSHCLTVLQQFHSHNPAYLKTNQQYIMCKLLMGRVFQGVNRKSQYQRTQQEYAELFDEKKFFIQQLLQINYKQI